MFNEFNLNDEEIMKIINEHRPLIIKASTFRGGFEEDLMQEIQLEIFRVLTKNRKK